MNDSQPSIKDSVSDYVVMRLSSQLVSGTELVEGEPPLFDMLMDGLSDGIEMFFKTNPSILSSNLDEHPLFLAGRISKQLGLPRAKSYQDDRVAKIDRLVLQRVDDYIKSNSNLLEKLKRKRQFDNEKERSIVDELIRSVKEQLGLDSLELSAPLAGGLSGSRVLRVYVAQAGHSYLGVLKTTTSEKDFAAEKRGLELVPTCWLSEFSDPNFSEAKVEVDGDTHYALVTSLAFPPSPFSHKIQSLHQKIADERDRKRVSGVMKVLAPKVAEVFYDASVKKVMSRAEFCQKVLTAWPGMIESLAQEEFWFPVGLPSAQERSYFLCGKLVDNPIRLVSEQSFGEEEGIEFRFAVQHGDLNARNILLDHEPGECERPALIDFEKLGDTSAIIDPCYLALFILEAGQPDYSRDNFSLSVPKAFVGAVCNHKDAGPDLGMWQLSLDSIAQLFEPLWKNANSPEAVNSLTNQVHLTLGITALVRAYYEVKSLHKGRKTDFAEVEYWSTIFFQISALALIPVAS